MTDLTQNDWRLQSQNNEVIILDVRTPDEYSDGKIPNAINIDIYKGQGFIYEVEEKLDKTKDIYVYCKSGGRSAQACHILNQLGFEKTFNLLGGFSEWQHEVEIPH